MSSLYEMPQEYVLALAGIFVAYFVLGALLLSINAASRWMWLVKGGAILVTAFFFVQSYNSTIGLTGWPSFERPPARFQLLWANWIEPNKFYAEPGSIYLWINPLDETESATRTPRAYRLAFDGDLALRVGEAQALLMEGKAVVGTAAAIDRSTSPTGVEGGAGAVDRAALLTPENFTTPPMHVTFEELTETGRR